MGATTGFLHLLQEASVTEGLGFDANDREGVRELPGGEAICGKVRRKGGVHQGCLEGS